MKSMYGYLAAIIAGAAIKQVDFLEDQKKGKHWVKWPLGIIAGLAVGYILAFSPASVLFIAIIGAQVLMGKIDKPVHGLAVVVAAAIPFIFGMQWVNVELLLPFFVVAALDEVEFEGGLKPMREYRLWLKGATFVAGIVSGIWVFFITLMCFDLAYLAVAKFVDKDDQIVDK